MSNMLRIHYGGNPVHIADIPNYGVIVAAGTSVPSNGSKGYAPGCLFIVIDPNAASNLYVNDGTKDSSLFKAVQVV
ncbi:MAG: hypothetical protein KatS3mg087_1130 [Patescibacteria group bacterium]|nr:MAG: hypothetical protein KatS3mg087_1130 [Patescibacteria group bacterium]